MASNVGKGGDPPLACSTKSDITSVLVNGFGRPTVENEARSRGTPFLQLKVNETLLGGQEFVKM